MKPDFELDQVRLFNCDCMDFMAEIPDKHYELAIIDTPYGIGAGNMVMGKGKNKSGAMIRIGITILPTIVILQYYR